MIGQTPQIELNSKVKVNRGGNDDTYAVLVCLSQTLENLRINV